MLAIEISFNLFLFTAMVIACFGIGFFARSSQLSSLRKKVLELESEMLSNHADILDLQREKVQLEQQIKQSKIPVIPMRASKDDDSLKFQEVKKVANQGSKKQS
jgi:hypothetical protein